MAIFNKDMVAPAGQQSRFRPTGIFPWKERWPARPDGGVDNRGQAASA